MSTVKEQLVPTINANLGKFVQKYNLKDAGTGTKFWVTLLKEKVKCKVMIHLSNDKTKVYARATYAEGKSLNFSLGMYYDTFQSLGDYEGQEIDAVLAPRIPNPALTDADIAGQEANIASSRGEVEGKRAVANIKAARASDGVQGELVLVSYTEPDM
jgi:hypothetical protein